MFPAVCISLLAVGGAARAEDKSSIEPRAERILQAAIANLAAAKSYMFRGEMTTEGPAPRRAARRVRPAPFRPPCAARTVRGRHPPGRGARRRATCTTTGRPSHLWRPGGERLRAPGRPRPPSMPYFDTMTEKIGFVPPLSAILREERRPRAPRTEGKVLAGQQLRRPSVSLRGVETRPVIWPTDRRGGRRPGLGGPTESPSSSVSSSPTRTSPAPRSSPPTSSAGISAPR